MQFGDYKIFNKVKVKSLNMGKITYENFKSIMAYDITQNQNSIEIEFSVDNCDAFQSAWLGKMSDREANKAIYWFGLTEDGSQAYDFVSFEEFVNAKVFNDKSLIEIWDSITLLSIDACDIQERLPFYLSLT